MPPLTSTFSIPRASTEQFAGIVSRAGEAAANVFAAGGKALILRVGHYEQLPDPNTGQIVENFVAGINPKTDELLLEVVAEVDPAQGNRDVNPFVLNMWPLTVPEKRHAPTTIEEALRQHFQQLPPYVTSPAHFTIQLSSDQSMYLLRKALSSVFALALLRGGAQVEFILMRGNEISETVPTQKVVKTKEKRPQRQRDPKTGQLLFKEAVDKDGKPIFEPVCDRVGRPLYDPATGEIKRHRKIEYVTQEVEMEVESFQNVDETLKRTPVFLQITKSPEIDFEKFPGASINESQYDPTWMLADVLAGKCRDRKPFHGMGE